MCALVGKLLICNNAYVHTHDYSYTVWTSLPNRGGSDGQASQAKAGPLLKHRIFYKEICCASFFSTKLMSVSYVHGQCKLH